MRPVTLLSALSLTFLTVAQAACVRRTIFITSEPSGALVHLNHQEVGRTPVEVDFLYYGDYDVRLEHREAEPLVTHAEAKPPWWDTIPLDLAAEALPGERHVRLHWHYDLEAPAADADALVDRARELRSRIAEDPEAPADASPDTDEDQPGVPE